MLFPVTSEIVTQMNPLDTLKSISWKTYYNQVCMILQVTNEMIKRSMLGIELFVHGKLYRKQWEKIPKAIRSEHILQVKSVSISYVYWG